MDRKITIGILNVLFIITSALVIGSCDLLVPEEFDSKEYPIPEIDMKASEILARTVIDSLGRPISTACYAITSRTMDTMTDSATRASNTDNQIILSRYSGLVDSLSATALQRDTIMAVSIDTTNNVAYALLNVGAGQSNDVYIYTSLRYNETNVDDYVTIQLVKSDTSLVSYNDIMLPEASYARAEVVPISGGEKVVSTIRSRYRFHVDAGNYIVRFTMSEAVAIRSFKLLIFSL